jgi:hypothetical protein
MYYAGMMAPAEKKGPTQILVAAAEYTNWVLLARIGKCCARIPAEAEQILDYLGLELLKVVH